MSTLDQLLESLPDAGKDLRVNLRGILDANETLDAQTRLCLALASAWTARSPELASALAARAREAFGAGAAALIDDARAAASIMGMNNVYYRGKHMLADAEVQALPARLRMQRLASPATSKTAFELAALAASAITGCEFCMQAHARVVQTAGLTHEHVHEALRIAAVVNGVAIALETREPSSVGAGG